jgi:homoserine acetyltransferase
MPQTVTGDHSAQLTRELAQGGVDDCHTEISSQSGHDSFLLDVPEYHRRISLFLNEAHETVEDAGARAPASHASRE